MATLGHMVGEYFHPIESLAVISIHKNKAVEQFISDTRIATLEELIARVRVGPRHQVFCNFGTMAEVEYRKMAGYGKSFVNIINEILSSTFDKGCQIAEMHPSDIPQN